MSRLACALAVAALAASSPAPARADSRVDVTIDLNQTGQELAAELGLDRMELEDRLAAGMQRGLEMADLDGFLRSFADATSFSNRGVGVDYASNSDRVMVGVAANLAVSAEVGDGSPTAGVATNVTLMGGLNLKRWQRPEWTIYGNFYHRGGDSGSLDGSISSGGLHAQRKFFQPTRGLKRLLVQWGGIDVTAGLELARWSFRLGDEISTEYEIEGDGGEVRTIAAAATGTFDLRTLTVTAPVEVTTNLRLLYLMSLYTGFGFDVQAGRTRLDANLGGGLTAAEADETPRNIGSLRFEATGRNRPSIVGVHALLGLQVNLWKVKLFTQLSYQPRTTASFALGARVDI